MLRRLLGADARVARLHARSRLTLASSTAAVPLLLLAPLGCRTSEPDQVPDSRVHESDGVRVEFALGSFTISGGVVTGEVTNESEYAINGLSMRFPVETSWCDVPDADVSYAMAVRQRLEPGETWAFTAPWVAERTLPAPPAGELTCYRTIPRVAVGDPEITVGDPPATVDDVHRR